MLVLTRRHNESVSLYIQNVKIGEVTVVESMSGGQVKLGFDLDKQISVIRNEIVPQTLKGKK